MINDIPRGLDGVEMSLFGDDSSISAGHRNHSNLQNKIQLSLNSIDEWCNRKRFKICVSKTLGVLFTRKRKISNAIIRIGPECFKIEITAKFLGVIFDHHHRLTWKPRI